MQYGYLHTDANLTQSELHMYRGHQKTQPGFILGHEFTGTVVKVGRAVKTVKVGDEITSPFSTTWYVVYIMTCINPDS